MSETLLEVKDLRTQFKRGKKDWITAVNGVSFTCQRWRDRGLGWRVRLRQIRNLAFCHAPA